MDRDANDIANRAFPAEPDDVELYPAAGQQRVLAALNQDVSERLHLLCLTGPAGSGKTRMLRALRQSFRHGLVGLLEEPNPGRMLVDLARMLRLDVDDANESSLRRRIVMLLSMTDQQRQPIIQIVDRADTLLTEDIELLLHFFPRGHASIILAAEAEPAAWLTGRSMPTGPVQIDRSYRLDSLTADETAEYIRHRLRLADLPDDLLRPEIVATIHRKSGGLPGLINQFSAEALAQAGSPATARRSTYPVRDPAAGAEFPDAFERTVSVASPVHEFTPSPITERRRSVETVVRPVVAPSEARYRAEHISTRTTHRLRRSVRFWRTVAMLAIAALVLDLSRSDWMKQLPVDFALFESLLDHPATKPARSQASANEHAGSVSPERHAAPGLPPGSSSLSAEKAPRSPPVAMGGMHSDAQATEATNEPMVTPHPAQSAVPATRHPVREPENQAGIEAEAAQSDRAKSDVAKPADGGEDSDHPPSDSAVQETPKPASGTGDGPSGDRQEQTAKTGRNDVKDDRAGSAAAPEPQPLPSGERREIARLYAERAEYEWRNGELGAAMVSIRRGLDTDPGNPRLLEMRARLRTILEEP